MVDKCCVGAISDGKGFCCHVARLASHLYLDHLLGKAQNLSFARLRNFVSPGCSLKGMHLSSRLNVWLEWPRRPATWPLGGLMSYGMQL